MAWLCLNYDFCGWLISSAATAGQNLVKHLEKNTLFLRILEHHGATHCLWQGKCKPRRQARAIENECYVAIAGCVGNLPKVNNMEIQYAQSAVFTPSDFAFPSNGIKAETTANTEMTLIVDVDINLLKELHEHGSVRTMKDRKHDLYQLKKIK